MCQTGPKGQGGSARDHTTIQSFISLLTWALSGGGQVARSGGWCQRPIAWRQNRDRTETDRLWSDEPANYYGRRSLFDPLGTTDVPKLPKRDTHRGTNWRDEDRGTQFDKGTETRGGPGSPGKIEKNINSCWFPGAYLAM